MQLGLFNLMTLRDRSVTAKQILDDTRLMVEGAEELGFDTAWFAEHHFSNYSICPSPLMMASFAAGFTKRIKLGTAVLVLPFYNPMRMIEEIALLDVQSGGRARIGIGYGYQLHEFKRFNRAPAEKVEVALEAWDILEMAFRDYHVDYHGKHFDITDCPLAITPLSTWPSTSAAIDSMGGFAASNTCCHGYSPLACIERPSFSVVAQRQPWKSLNATACLSARGSAGGGGGGGRGGGRGVRSRAMAGR